MSRPEPWMRGPLEGVDPLVAPVFHSFTQVREDLSRYTAGLTDEQVWTAPAGAPPLGFHLRHIAGSVDRLTTYLMNEPLSDEQLAALKSESEPGASLGALLDEVDRALGESERRLRTIDPASIDEPRWIGRKRLPTTVLGLLVHIAEHSQRHLGQAITTARVIASG